MAETEANKPAQSEQPPAILLKGVGVLREQRWILRHIDWLVPQGAAAAILGPNGSGKSTLARIIGCHLWPTEGTCSILNGRFGAANLTELRRKIRLVQPAGPYDIDSNLTARQVVLTGFFSSLNLYDRPTDSQQDQATRLLRLVGLSHVADQTYARMSSGERVRSLLARALASDPPLLLLDEPTAGLDLLAREQVLATVAALSEQPAPPTIIMITHHVEELGPATSQVLLMDEGQIAAAGAPGDVLTEQTLSRVYRCPVQVSRAGGRTFLQVHPQAWKRL